MIEVCEKVELICEIMCDCESVIVVNARYANWLWKWMVNLDCKCESCGSSVIVA